MTPQFEAELKRKAAGTSDLVPWELVADIENPATSRADPVIDYGVRARLNDVKVHDDYQAGEVLADQTGNDTVRTFTFAVAVDLVVIESAGANLVSRADPFGGTPAVSTGIRCNDGAPVYVPVETTVVKVYVPSGATCTVYGLRRT